MSASAKLRELRTELRKVEAEIDAAYWAFERSPRAKPPSMVVPEAYRRRTELNKLLREHQRKGRQVAR